MRQTKGVLDLPISWAFVTVLVLLAFAFMSEQLCTGTVANIVQLEKAEIHPVLVSKEGSPKQGGPKMILKTVSGRVGAKGPNGLSLVAETKEAQGYSAEIWFNFGESFKLSSVQEGDGITIVYEQAEDGSKRVVKKIMHKEK